MKKLISTLLVALMVLFAFIAKASSDINDFNKYLGSNVKYPEKARIKNLQGNSIILFTLTKGSLNQLKINTELGAGTDVEVLNTILAYPSFKSVKDGKYALTMEFRLNGSTAPIVNQNATTPEGYIALKLTIVGSVAIQKIEVTSGQGKTAKTILVNDPGHTSMFFRGNGLDPKVIVDSIQMDYAEFKGLIPDRIESIQILRGVTAVANYGTDALNGVIVITTKKDKPKLSVKKEIVVEQDEDPVYNFVSMKNPPSYPGGMAKFYNFLRDNIKNPDSNIQGNVHLSFIVEKDGSLSNIKILRKLGVKQDEEAIRVIKLSKRWNPGMQNGKLVRVMYNIPVRFN